MTWKHNEDCHAHGGWCEECTAQGLRRRRNAENCLRKGGRQWKGGGGINTLTERWHNFARSAQEDVTDSGVRLRCHSCADPQAAGQCGWWLCLISVASGHKSQRKCKPMYILARGKMGSPNSPPSPLCTPPKRLVLFQLQARPELSEKSELIVILWVASKEFGLERKKITTQALQSDWKWDRNVHLMCFQQQRKHDSAEIKFGASERSTEVIFYVLFHPEK